MSEEFNEELNVEEMKILVATDCHLGFADRDGERGNDSLATFEEILSIAKAQEVDFILLGGDLFHDNKPSRKTLHKCMQLIRQYCMGCKPIQVEFLSDQSENFKHNAFPVVNYEDPNLNISIPIFTIHGNHDDPCGMGSYSPVDVLSVSGLVNYFGQQTDLGEIRLSPLLMQKGLTKLALYGLGSIREERIHRLFKSGCVKLLQPVEDSESWFKLFVLHQNRAKHGPTNYIPEDFLSSCLDLVIWGHEHECRITPEYNVKQKFFISQPGSSVATSLCPGEAVKKHVGILRISGKTFKMEPVPLQTVRQFYIEDIDVSLLDVSAEDPDPAESVYHYCCERVDALLEKAGQEHSGNPSQPKKPLVRLRLEYDDPAKAFNRHRLGQKYVEQIANPKDVIIFQQKRAKKTKMMDNTTNDAAEGNFMLQSLEVECVENQILEYFENADAEAKLQMLSERGLGQALKIFIEKMEKDMIPRVVDSYLMQVQNHLKTLEAEDDLIACSVEKFKAEYLDRKDVDYTTLQGGVPANASGDRFDSDDLSDADMNGLRGSNTPETSIRGRGRGRSRGKQLRGSRAGSSSGGRGRGRARGSTRGAGKSKSRVQQASSASESESVDENDSFLGGSRQTGRSAKSKKGNRGVAFSDDD